MAYGKAREIKLGHYTISQLHPPLLVAELSGNHNKSFERAIQLIDAAKSAGAHAVKLQTFTPDTITLNVQTASFYVDNQKSLWYGKSLHEIYQVAHTPWEWHEALFQYCHSQGLLCFSSPFDQTAVDFLESIHCPCYKVASSENTDDLILLKCTAAYPAPPHEINLKTLPNLSDIFNCQVGLSDHTLGIGVAIASVALGATLIEKHLTLSRAEGGVDAAFSMEPAELAELVKETERAWLALGKVTYGASNEE